MKMKVQQVFPLSKKSILVYFLVLAQAIVACEEGTITSEESYSEYFSLIEATN